MKFAHPIATALFTAALLMTAGCAPTTTMKGRENMWTTR